MLTVYMQAVSHIGL